MEINENVSIEELNARNQRITFMRWFIAPGGSNFKGGVDLKRLSCDHNLTVEDWLVADNDFVIGSLPHEKFHDFMSGQTLFRCAPVQIREGDIIVITNHVTNPTSEHMAHFRMSRFRMTHFRISVLRRAEFMGSYDIIRVLVRREGRYFPDIYAVSAVSVVNDEDTTITKLKNKIEEENNIAECAICVEEKKTINLKCQGKHDHTYCFDCFKKWYIDQNHKSCVLCFAEFDVKNICAPLVE